MVGTEGWLAHVARVSWATLVEHVKAKFRCSLVYAWPWLRLEMDITWNLFHPAACISFSDSLTFSLWLLNKVGRRECCSADSQLKGLVCAPFLLG